VAKRSGWKVVDFYEDAGISGAKGRDKRPSFNRPAIRLTINEKIHKSAISRYAAPAQVCSDDDRGTCSLIPYKPETLAPPFASGTSRGSTHRRLKVEANLVVAREPHVSAEWLSVAG
jgi:hypothetical protein